jgi:RimJ/RimL family protein N-acetyltransferase
VAAGFALPDRIPELRSERLTLRAFRESDREAWYAWSTDPAVFGPTSANPATSRSEFDGLLEAAERRFASGEAVFWAVCDATTNQAFGQVGLEHLDPWHRRAEIGYTLAAAAWGKGFASEAARAAIGWAVPQLGLARVEATVMVGNERSPRVLEKLGFVREGTLRSYKNVRGEMKDYWIFGRVETAAG